MKESYVLLQYSVVKNKYQNNKKVVKVDDCNTTTTRPIGI